MNGNIYVGIYSLKPKKCKILIMMYFVDTIAGIKDAYFDIVMELLPVR